MASKAMSELWLLCLSGRKERERNARVRVRVRWWGAVRCVVVFVVNWGVRGQHLMAKRTHWSRTARPRPAFISCCTKRAQFTEGSLN